MTLFYREIRDSIIYTHAHFCACVEIKVLRVFCMSLVGKQGSYHARRVTAQSLLAWPKPKYTFNFVDG